MLIRPLSLLNFFVAVVMFSIGLRTNSGEFLNILRDRALFARTLLANCVLIPAIGFLLVSIIDFALGSDRKIGASEIVAEAGVKSPEGVLVGVILHAREGELSELEVYSTQELDTSFTLPAPNSLERYD